MLVNIMFLVQISTLQLSQYFICEHIQNFLSSLLATRPLGHHRGSDLFPSTGGIY
jgi:hypothetical protein